NLGATGAGMAGILSVFLLLRLPFFKSLQNSVETEDTEKIKSIVPNRSLWVSVSAYIVLVVLAFAVNLIPPLKAFLSTVRLSLAFPAMQTSLGWQTAAESGRVIKVFAHPAAILFYSSVIAYFIYLRAGYLKKSSLNVILDRVANSAVKSSLGIIAMVGVAVIMQHTGMTNLLAQGMSRFFGDAFFPLISPFIGALGAFITGSNNNSNVLFAVLQMQTAELLGLSVPLILGAQTAGASLGSIIAPAKIIVGCSTVGLGSEEGKVIGKVLGYGLIPIVFVALIVLWMSF
nr:L-lactate permease [Anaerolineaceae bacterium]